MIYLILAIIGSALISIVMRLSEGKIRGNISMLAANYLTCMIMAVCYIGFDNMIPTGEKVGITTAMGLFNGVLYVLGLVLMQVNIRKNGVTLPNVFSKLGSLIVPLVASVLFFGEVPGVLQVIGAVIAMLSIVAINKSGEQGAIASKGMLAILFIADGIGSVMSKLFGEVCNPLLSDHFLFLTFASAFTICLFMIIKGKESFGINEVIYGAGIGIPNFLSSRFLLQALAELPAVVVYPTRGVATIVLISLAGVLMFKERLSKRQWYAMGAILVSVALLNI